MDLRFVLIIDHHVFPSLSYFSKMSSLAGALIPPRSLTSPTKSETVMDETGDQPDQGMADLFGNEEEEQEEE